MCLSSTSCPRAARRWRPLWSVRTSGQRMYGFVRKLVEEGRQAYIVCPAVEEKPEDGGQGGQWAQAGPVRT